MRKRFSIQVLPWIRNSCMATRVLQAEVQPTEYFLVHFQEGIDQIRASNPFSVANIIFLLTCHHNLIQTSSLRTLPLQSPVIFRHSPFMISFVTRTASFPKSIGVVDSCLSAANSRKKIDEYLRLNFCESCFFFIPCIKISY